MLLISCPYCQETRPEIEFRNSGEAWLVRPRDPSTLNDEQWGDFLYGRSNTKGWLGERWRHVHGCGRFFNAIRHTVTDQIIMVSPSGTPRPSDSELQKLIAARESEMQAWHSGEIGFGGSAPGHDSKPSSAKTTK
ncbi:MAG: sarcosine oxidase subunit delta [Candidatus Pacebacteria bacterium]|nr:sarcosine oxidase subunit delta [Candidatus Paceibacterota bacterium]